MVGRCTRCLGGDWAGVAPAVSHPSLHNLSGGEKMKLPWAEGEFEVTPEIRAGLYVKFRGVDVQNELALMCLWLAKNPSVRPKRPIRFIENWLKKCRNKGGSPFD